MDNDAETDFFANWTEETLAINGVEGQIPSMLFKFVSCDSKYFRHAALELLLHNRLRLSRPDEFNDPFDCALCLEPATSDEARIYLTDVLADQGLSLPNEELEQRVSDPEKFREVTQESMRSTLGKAGICSFSSSVKNPLMWAHYASSHAGLAYVFRQGRDSSFGAMPVRYQSQQGTKVSLSKRDEVPLAVLTKGLDWRYEKEWRLVETKQGGSWKILGEGVLHGVLFGAKCSDEDIEFVFDLIKRRADAGLPQISVYGARINEEEFKLDFYQLIENGLRQIDMP